jgi:hypothetical protein
VICSAPSFDFFRLPGPTPQAIYTKTPESKTVSLWGWQKQHEQQAPAQHAQGIWQ